MKPAFATDNKKRKGHHKFTTSQTRSTCAGEEDWSMIWKRLEEDCMACTSSSSFPTTISCIHLPAIMISTNSVEESGEGAPQGGGFSMCRIAPCTRRAAGKGRKKLKFLG
ncbi:hypothetical protein GUJ93_ZPchr0002g25031 [Zizania palustris]|uniref:Uncharacterized protein n=1 Tax=Zizania palustris TaxID=103762 RepID=A0A8J5RUR8_ZIZPA|nr:hypothetical protein GUJ93_ZPchr0002g25031 [Zizania palustris]